eukprot:363248-Chlamydomonas_euryale.AAC.10
MMVATGALPLTPQRRERCHPRCGDGSVATHAVATGALPSMLQRLVRRAPCRQPWLLEAARVARARQGGHLEAAADAGASHGSRHAQGCLRSTVMLMVGSAAGV